MHRGEQRPPVSLFAGLHVPRPNSTRVFLQGPSSSQGKSGECRVYRVRHRKSCQALEGPLSDPGYRNAGMSADR